MIWAAWDRAAHCDAINPFREWDRCSDGATEGFTSTHSANVANCSAPPKSGLLRGFQQRSNSGGFGCETRADACEARADTQVCPYETRADACDSRADTQVCPYACETRADAGDSRADTQVCPYETRADACDSKADTQVCPYETKADAGLCRRG